MAWPRPATLSRYFPDVEAILLAWHQRQIAAHESHGHHDSELAAFLHRDDRVTGAEQQVHDLICDLVAQVAATGDIRDDDSSDQLASYCLQALPAARSLPSHAAVRRLVTVTLAGLHPIADWLIHYKVSTSSS